MLAVLAVLGALYWLLGGVAAILVMRGIPLLRTLTPSAPPRWPRVSILIPACDEEATVAATLEKLLADDYPDLEIVAVNDRSRDGTGAVLDRFAATDARVRAVHVRELPHGWLGKLNALRCGLEKASGEWLIVMDADVLVEPGTLRKLVAWCEQTGVDYATALPAFLPAGVLVDPAVAMGMRTIVSGLRAWEVSNPRSKAAMGFGAYNLVRRSAFDRTPGFEWLRLEVADDVGLALLMKRSGARCVVVNARHEIALTFYASFGEMIRRLEKNAYAIVGQYRLSRLLALVAFLFVFELAPFAALLASGWPAVLSAVSLVVALATCGAMSRWVGLSASQGLAFPIGVVVISFTELRAGIIGWRTGGIQWRGTFYPAAMMREGIRVSFP